MVLLKVFQGKNVRQRFDKSMVLYQTSIELTCSNIDYLKFEQAGPISFQRLIEKLTAEECSSVLMQNST